MITIGITGGTGAGKTSALRALGRLGAGVIDCDEVYHELLAGSERMRREIALEFPEAVSGDGIDRVALGRAVFGDSEALETLSEITHKYVDAEVRGRLAGMRADGLEAAAVDAIALIDSGLHEVCDVVVGVVAPEEARRARIMSRDGIDEERARARIGAQRTETFFRRNCDRIIVNDYDDAARFEDSCVEFFRELINSINQGGRG
jgi:dephospho-CoA kinase